MIRLDRPDRQAALLLKLFDGSRAAHPAAALVAWKRASKGDLGKPLEAAIALFNPLMVPEWRAIDGATFWLDPRGARSGPRYRALAPHDDDGALAALAMTARLSTGADEPPLGIGTRMLPVVRLRAAAPLLAVEEGHRVALAGDRESLVQTLNQRGESPSITLLNPPRADGLTAAIDLERMNASGASSLALGRVITVAKGLRLARLEGRLGLNGDRLVAEIEGLRQQGKKDATIAAATIDPSWPTGFSHERMMAVVSIAVGPGAGFMDRVFEVLDRVQRLDPAYASTAPLRVRLNLTARAAGVNLEADLWPRLRGLTIAATAAAVEPGKPTGMVVILHADSDASAARIVREFAPRLGRLVGGLKADPDLKTERFRGRAAGKAIEVGRRGRDVLLGWGDDAIVALKMPESGPRAWPAAPPARYGLVWPARCVPAVAAMAAAARASLTTDPPLVWTGWDQGLRSHDRLVWSGLKARVRTFLEQIPLDPPPGAPGRPNS